MAPKLSPEQRKAMKQQPDTPIYVVDTETQIQYVLLPANAYQRVKVLFDDEPCDVRETYAAQEEVAREAGWDDPEMDVYNDRDVTKPQG